VSGILRIVVTRKSSYSNFQETGIDGFNGCMKQENDMEFISETKRTLASRAIGRDVHERNGVFELREPSVSYSAHFDPKKYVLRPENTYLWNINGDILVS